MNKYCADDISFAEILLFRFRGWGLNHSPTHSLRGVGVGCFPTKDTQIADASPLRSGHLDIKDAQCAKNKNGRKISYHIISRLGATGV